MTDLNAKFLNLEIADDIFKGIRYFVTGEVHEKIESLLKSGSAEHQNYFSDYVTHLIVGTNPEENDIADANDVYEIPAVTPQWVLMSASLKKRLDFKPYLFSMDSKLFGWQTFCFSKVTEDRNNLWGLITYNGGTVHTKLTKMCNFLVTGVTDSPKYVRAESIGPENIKIVTPDWIYQAVKTKSLPDPALFHPKLINWPKPLKPTEPTTAITGFEPETPESKEKAEEKAVMDSTQALLEKLKQRMPWNQPPATTSSSSDPVAPPNVVAPSFLSKIQNNQDSQVLKHQRQQISTSQSSPAISSFASTGTQSPSHVPRSIVHHTPNNQQNQPSVLQHSPLNISRLIGQPQSTRPTSLQQLRGQLNTSQIHQQLLQQRIQQQNQQNIIQRTSTGQMSVNQQLLHQQLSQGQRQALQNQLMNQQNLLNQQQGLSNQNQGLNLLSQVQQGQNRLVESQSQQTPMLGQQDPANQQFNPQNQQSQLNNQQNQLSNQQNQLLSPQNQLVQSSSPNQVIRSPQQSQNQLLNPQQIQNQLMSHQQTQQNQVNQLQQQSQLMHQQANHFLSQQQPQNQLNQQQDRAGQLVNQQQERTNQLFNQQDRTNQLMNQQDRASHLLSQQDRASQLINQQDRASQLISQQDRASQLLNQQDRTNQLLSQQERANQLIGQQDRANQLLGQQDRTNQLLGQQDRTNQLLNQQQNQNQLNQQQNQSNQMLRQHQNQNDLQNQLLGQLSPQTQMIGSQQLQNQQLAQQNQQFIQQNQSIQPNQTSQQNQQQIIQQTQAMNQGRVNQQSPVISQNQLINQQNQQILNRANQQQQNPDGLLSLSPNHHLSQLSPSQLQQLQQLKREQQLLNQGQNQLTGLNQQNISLTQQNIGLNQQNLGLNQQNIVNQGHNQQLVNPNQQLIGQNQQMQINQQLIQNRVIQQQNIGQQLNQGQNFAQQGINQHLINQKQQLFNQQQINTNQHQQLIQNQQNLSNQQQFVSQGQFEAIQQQKLNQPGGQGQLTQQSLSHMSVQALNQQLNSQNLGQQLNQQLLQQNQQTGLSQGTLNQPNLNQAMGMDQGMNQNISLLNQQPVTINSQGNLNLQALNQGTNQQINQINPGMNQQVIRAQFPQQVLVSQGQQGGPQRAQLNQQIWGQQQQAGTPIQGQQIVRHPVNVTVQQSPTSGGVGPRIQWPPGQQPAIPQRQFIQLDAHTHNQLQKMPPDQQALFVAKLQQKQRQLQLAKQVQQRGGGHILIRGNVPPGLTAQQQVQWLQQQAKQQGIVLPPNIQQNLTPGTITAQQGTQAAAGVPSHAPGLSPINQNAGPTQQFVGEQPTAQQLQLRQYRSGLQQLQLQREQAQKNALAQGGLPPQAVVRAPLGQPPTADSTTNPQVQVNPKTKTALANMLSIKLQSGGTIGTPARAEGIQEPSAAGTLRMMTAQHNAAINSKPQEIISLQQRRVISGPNGEIIKPPGVPALSLTPQSEPPKLQYSQKAPVPVQHRVGPFYGHNPNLKLPPDLFLLGCIFVVVEVEEYLEEHIPGWQQQIEKYGGEVEKQYCSKVTHVLCETQRHGVVMQALRDLKRCVTIRWLSDVIKRKQVLPPWTALHLPQIYLDITPASKHLISISGFEGNIRQVVKQMIQYTGAKCTTYFSKHNTLLICAKGEGKKFNHAKKWGIPVVNVQWLTDVILGNFTAMNQMDNQVYQTYSNPPNLSFDPKLVPNMMHAWKAPINISQESYERVKRSASPVSLPKPKKMKVENTDENENITEEAYNPQYRILFTQFPTERLKVLEKMVSELGGIVSKDYKDFTHLIVPKLMRSHKLLFAVAKSSYILPERWLEESSTLSNFLPECGFTLQTEEFNQTYNVTIERTLCSGNRDRLLEGKTFWLTPSVFPSKKILSELIDCSGGKLERIRRSRAQIEVTNNSSPFTYFILIAENDLHLVADLLKNKKEKQRVVCNVELVLSAILRQEFEVEPYVVSVV